MLSNGYRAVLRLKFLPENTGHKPGFPTHINSFVTFVPFKVNRRQAREGALGHVVSNLAHGQRVPT